ncbi:hypothetical protein NQ318_003351, partial [Aromia moschata]
DLLTSPQRSKFARGSLGVEFYFLALDRRSSVSPVNFKILHVMLGHELETKRLLHVASNSGGTRGVDGEHKQCYRLLTCTNNTTTDYLRDDAFNSFNIKTLSTCKQQVDEVACVFQ